MPADSPLNVALESARDELKALNEKIDRLLYGNGDWTKGVFGKLQILSNEVTAVGARVDALTRELRARDDAAAAEAAEQTKGRWQAVVALIMSSGTFLCVVVPAVLDWLKK